MASHAPVPPTQVSDPKPAAATPPSPATAESRRLAGAALLVMAFFILSRATGLLREVIIANEFGAGAALDAYLAAFRIPDLIFQLVAGGALGSAFIPTFAQYWAKDDVPGAWLLFSRTLNLVVLLLTLLAAAAAILAEPLVAWIIAPGFDPDQRRLTADLMRGMLASTVIFGASGLIMGALNALQHFLLPAAAPVLYNLAIILGAWWLGPIIGVYGLVVGAVGGALAHLLVQLPGLWQQCARYTFALSVRDPGVREVMRLMAPRVLGLLFVQLHFLVNTILASRLAPGSLSALNYAWLLMLLPLGIFAQAIGTVAFPTFAAQVAAGRRDAMRTSFGLILRLVVFLTLPAAATLWVLGTPIVRALFEHGEFSARSTALVVFALRFYALGLLGHAIVEIAVRVFYALHDTWTPVLVGVGAMALNVALSLWWVGALDHGGLALANTTATSVEMVLLLLLLHRRMGGLKEGALAAALLRSLVAVAALIAAQWGWQQWAAVLDVSPSFIPWIEALGGIGAGALAYLVVGWLIGSREVRWLLGLVQRTQT